MVTTRDLITVACVAWVICAGAAIGIWAFFTRKARKQQETKSSEHHAEIPKAAKSSPETLLVLPEEPISSGESPIPRIPRELLREPRGARALRKFIFFAWLLGWLLRIGTGLHGPYEDLIFVCLLDLLFWQLVATAIIWGPKLAVTFVVWLFRFLAWLVK